MPHVIDCGDGPGLHQGCSEDRGSHSAAASRAGHNMDEHAVNMTGGLMVASTHPCCDSRRLTQQLSVHSSTFGRSPPAGMQELRAEAAV